MKMRTIGWIFFFASVAGLVSICHAAKKKKAKAITSTSSATIVVPNLAGRSYTVMQLFDLINANNPGRTSDFLVLTTQGSKGARIAGYDWSPYANQTVILKQDASRINTLTQARCFPDTQTQVNYLNSMVWFQLPGLPAMYLIDPNPGPTVRAGKTVRSPAFNNINSWAAVLKKKGLM